MDAPALRRAVLAARTFSVEHGGRSFSVRLPTTHELAVACLRAGVRGTVETPADMAGWAEVRRDLLERGVVGWLGVTVGDLLPDAEETSIPVDFDPLLVPAVLDGIAGLSEVLGDTLMARIRERREATGALEKNLPRDVPGSAAVATAST